MLIKKLLSASVGMTSHPETFSWLESDRKLPSKSKKYIDSISGVLFEKVVQSMLGTAYLTHIFQNLHIYAFHTGYTYIYKQ